MKNSIKMLSITCLLIAGSITAATRNAFLCFENARKGNVIAHVLFIPSENFGDFLQSSGWSKKIANLLMQNANDITAQIEKNVEKAKEYSKYIESGKNILGSLKTTFETVAPDVALFAMRTKDYWPQVFPGMHKCTFKSGSSKSKLTNKKSITLILFGTDSYGLPKLDEIEFISSFNPKKSNYFKYTGPGEVEFKHIDANGKVKDVDTNLFLPVEVNTETNSLDIALTEQEQKEFVEELKEVKEEKMEQETTAELQEMEQEVTAE